MKLKKAYVEITNTCNLACAFCRGTVRPARTMAPEEFAVIAEKLRPYTGYIYLHLLGEPLTHPEPDKILALCKALDYKVTLVTNGTLIPQAAPVLRDCGCLYKICYSLHAYEANALPCTLDEYLAPIFLFAKESAGAGTINVFKLWNGGGQDALNGDILQKIQAAFGTPLSPARGGYTVAQNVYIDLADRFAWPDQAADETPPRFCMALRDQLGVLCDGTAVPCCLDADGALALGNLLTDSVEDVLNSPRARRILDGFSQGKPAEELCRRCGFAKQRFG